MIDLWDHETNAREVYRQAAMDPADPPGPHDLAEALMGRGWLCYLPRLASGWGFYSPVGDRERIYLRRGLTPMREAWTIYHELAERHLYPCRDVDGKETACDQLAACLRAPREAFRALVADVGLDLLQLADAVICSQTSAALRYGETTGMPLVVVSPGDVRVRGDEWGWPDEHELRRLARGRSVPSNVRRIEIDDARGRAVLVAA